MDDAYFKKQLEYLDNSTKETTRINRLRSMFAVGWAEGFTACETLTDQELRGLKDDK